MNNDCCIALLIGKASGLGIDELTRWEAIGKIELFNGYPRRGFIVAEMVKKRLVGHYEAGIVTLKG